jgi:hypothetical protein
MAPIQKGRQLVSPGALIDALMLHIEGADVLW